jgi:hypothetical protein
MMSYTIQEVHIGYQDNRITELAVVWQSNERGWVRASYCITKPCVGYTFFSTNELPRPELIQQVAEEGMNLLDELKTKYFPDKRKWEQ